jgi:diguanylate cyclase (GGDEF)-like protein
MADIDHFKRINDEWGHAVGDQAIQRFAAILRQYIRPGDLLGRYGGEEFCLVLPGADLQRGRELAEQLRAAVAANQGRGLGPGAALQMSASFGVAQQPVPSGAGTAVPHLAALIDRADRAMYRAKQQGRNRVVVHDAEAATVPVLTQAMGPEG